MSKQSNQRYRKEKEKKLFDKASGQGATNSVKEVSGQNSQKENK